MPYLSEEIKKGFDKYKYNSIDTSPLAVYVMHPFWNWLSEFYPKWLAPNVLTLAGFLSLVVNYLILAYFDMDFFASAKEFTQFPSIPKWVWLVCAILNFMSHTLDGTDGKQARRTGTSSPVGEMFDHGCDSWATLFFIIALYSVFGRGFFGGSPMDVLNLLFIVQMNFILAHWEKYITGVMYLPWAYDLSQNGMTLAYLLTFIFGTDTWQNFAFGENVTYAYIVIVFVNLVFWGLSLPASLRNIYVSYRDGTGNNLSFVEAMRPLVATVILFVFSAMWAHYSPNHILEVNPRLFYLAVGTTFSNIACRLIVSQMSSTRCDLFNPFLLLFVPLSCAAVFIPGIVISWELLLLQIYTGIVVLCHIIYAFLVVDEMCDHFNIRAFVIRPTK